MEIRASQWTHWPQQEPPDWVLSQWDPYTVLAGSCLALILIIVIWCSGHVRTRVSSVEPNQ